MVDIVPREDWVRYEPRGGSYVDLDPRQGPPYPLFVHHCAAASARDMDWLQRALAIQYYHRQKLNWRDYAYSWGIAGDGTIYEGRGIGAAGGHTRGWNTKAYAVVLHGEFNSQQPTDKQLNSLSKLIEWGSGNGFLRFDGKGHRDVVATSCPGNNLYSKLGSLPSPRELVVSATYTVKAGDTATAIAADHGLDFSELKALNPGGPPTGNWDILHPGDVLRVVEGREKREATTRPPRQEPAKEPSVNDLPLISVKHRNRGAPAARAQSLLAANGHPPAKTFNAQGRPDGIWGSGSDAAAKAFQRARKLGTDGIVGPQTWRALLGL